ncbi:uncharacterized protein LOC131847961 [Achroia grisella]|uniref:uncharacterized protein LOC131847961 n=1 Tax=Achroia grisella TaxID=688607 RepID=UPI0027D2A481|nr:uncharacterized protein LOC131847961 [Achroia grisella]
MPILNGRIGYIHLTISYQKIMKNEIHARHILGTRKQRSDESIDQYLRQLKLLAQKCSFKDVKAEQYRSEYIRDAFIAGISSHKIRQRLLENLELSLDQAFNQALSLEMAETNSRSFNDNIPLNAVDSISTLSDSQNKKTKTLSSYDNEASTSISGDNIAETVIAATTNKRRCFFCGSNVIHQRIRCPALNSTCQICFKKGHFANVCRSKQIMNAVIVNETNNSNSAEVAAISAASLPSLHKATVPITINKYYAEALIDTGSSLNFVNEELAHLLKLKQKPCQQIITLASLNHTSPVNCYCNATLQLNNHSYDNVKLLVVRNLCADIILGHDLLKAHHSLELKFGGPRDPLKICNVMAANLPHATLFSNLSPNVKPVAIKSRRYSEGDQQFIKEEVEKLLKDGIIEPSISPWRAQVLVTGGGIHRKRLVIDYSQTINKFTELDAYPLPNIEVLISKIARNKYFSQIDLKSAYHQVPIQQRERPYTAFEACGNLFQFTRIPFGVTNGVSAFQRTMQFIISNENLTDTYAYLDDVTVCGKDKLTHDANLAKFMATVAKYKITLNKDKCNFGSETINILGYTIENNVVRPDKERLKPLLSMPAPTDINSLKRVLGMFAHYSKWINNYSEKISNLATNNSFPLSRDAEISFESLKKDIANAALIAIDDTQMFTVETDASEHALAATLSQNSRPVAFFSRSLTESERNHSSIEKEASAIVESLRRWRHYLIGKHFLLITDQQSVSFMFNQKHSSKIKNEKIERWRLELSCFKFDIIYRPGKQNIVSDTLSRVCANMFSRKNLYELHNTLSHPGITRMAHWVRSKNLPYSITEIKNMTASCPICSEIKPRFANSKGRLIKATSPFERLSLDFKGPLPSNSENKYILTIVDEFSRFPFAYPCKDVSSATIIASLKHLFFTFGTPLYVHSDRGTGFMSQEFKDFLIRNDIACSRTTPYNPEGNGQVERLNGTLWRTIQLSLRSKNLDIRYWEDVLPLALHSIRSLLCTATNATPHEKMFCFPRRSGNGVSLPSWLMIPGPVLLKKNVRKSKYDPLVEEVELLESNPNYSIIRFADGREDTVSNRHLAPINRQIEEVVIEDETYNSIHNPSDTDAEIYQTASENENLNADNSGSEVVHSPQRPVGERRPPAYLNDYES